MVAMIATMRKWGRGEAEIVEPECRLQGLMETQRESGGGWRESLGFGGGGESATPLQLPRVVVPCDLRDKDGKTVGKGFNVPRVLGRFLE